MTTTAPAAVEFPYRVRWAPVLLACGFFGLGAVFFAYRAATNDRGLVINRLIPLGQDGATVFWWVMAVLSGLFVLAAVVAGVQRVLRPLRIAFTDTGFVVPRGPWSRAEVVIPYNAIGAVGVVGGGRLTSQDFLPIAHTGGVYTIQAARLPTNADLRRVAELLAERCPRPALTGPVHPTG